MSPEEFRHVEVAHQIWMAVFLGAVVAMLVTLLADNGSVFLEFVKWIGGM